MAGNSGDSIDYRERFHDPVEALRIAFESMQSALWTALPAQVISYNAATQTIVAQPTIQGQRRMPDGTVVPQNMPPIPDVPVHFQQGSNVVMTMPIMPGDECLLVFSSRCIDNWFASGGIQPPYEQRMHDLSDAFAIVGLRNLKRKLTNVSTTTAQLRSVDGETFVELDAAGQIVTITAPLQVTINTPVLRVNGQINATFDVTAGFGTVDSVTLQNHTHAQGLDGHGDAEAETDNPTAGT